MARELSAVLDHIAKIGELDLDDVAPTSHVVEVTGALRADEPRPVPAARGRARAGARGQRRGLPRPEPAGMSARDLLELSAARRPRRRSPPATLAPQRAVRGLPRAREADRRAGEEGLNCFTWVAEAAAAEEPPGAARRRAAGRQGPVLHRGTCPASRARGSSRATARRTPPPPSRACARAGAPLLAKTNQDEFAMGSSNENSALRPGAQPVGPRARARRLLGRQRRRGRGRPRAVGARHRHRRLDPPAGRAVRDRRAETHLRRGLALRDDRVRLLARPGRAAHARRRATRRCCCATWSGATRATRPRCELPHAIELPERRAARRGAARRPARS